MKSDLLKDSTSQESKPLLFFNDEINSGSFNMQRDEELLNSLFSGKVSRPILRVYGWNEKTLSLGRNQVLLEASLYPYPIVKRISGGQAVLHDISENELTYSFFMNFSQGAKKFYVFVGNILISFLEKYNLSPTFGYTNEKYTENFDCFESKTLADIVVKEKKIIGSAQYKKGNCIMQHGSIKLDLIRVLSGVNITFNDAIDKLKLSFESMLIK